MTVPGVSGGTMAMVAGCYDSMIAAVSRFFRRPVAACRLLVPLLAGGMCGIFLVAGVISRVLLVRYPFVTRYFFLGAVLGSVPSMIAKTGRMQVNRIPYFLAGILGIWVLSLLPAGFFLTSGSSAVSALLRLAAGMLTAGALVLPGISTSQVLWMLGLYEPLLNAVSTADAGYLLPFGAGLAAGTFLFAKLLDGLFENRQIQTWYVILGFVAGSLAELFPGLPPLRSIPACLFAAAAGFLILWRVTGKADQKRT